MSKQTELPGIEDTSKDPDIERDLDAYLEAVDAAKRAADDKKLKHTVLIARLLGADRHVYPYLCPRTGKKKRIRVDVGSKIKTERDASSGRKRKQKDVALSPGEKAERDAEREQKKAEAEVNRVEARRVKRENVEELREENVDPFAATRRAMEEVH